MNSASKIAFRAAAAIALSCFAFSAFAQDRATSMRISADKPIQIESNKLEVREKESLAIFSGNVAVKQDKTLLKSATMKVYYKKDAAKGVDSGSAATGSADIDRLEVSGGVYVRSDKQEATADEGDYDMDSEMLVLTGKKVVLAEGPNVVVGCKLTVHTKTGQARLDACKSTGGRVKMLLTPGSVKNQ